MRAIDQNQLGAAGIELGRVTFVFRHMGMAVEPMVGQMEDRLSEALGERIRLRFVGMAAGTAQATPAARAAQARDSAQSAAEQAIADDPFVQAMKRDFGARVVPQSVKPLDNP